MVISELISGSVVSAVDYSITGEIAPQNAMAAYWGGVLTRYTGFKSTVLINASNEAIIGSNDGGNPFFQATISGLGGAIGYGVGSKIIKSVADDL